MEWQNLKILEWFVGLIGMDLEKMAPTDHVKINTEAQLMARGLNPWMVDPIRQPNTTTTIKTLMKWFATRGEDYVNLKECQKRILTFMETLEREKENTKKPVRLINIETGETSDDIFLPLNARLLPNTPISIELKELDGKINVTYSSNDITETLLVYFVKALSGLPTQAIRRCPECKKWFLHLSARRKEFCSNKCAAKKGSRDQRRSFKEKKIDYAKELAAGAKRARTSYENKVKKKYPKAIVERRPRKYKD
jgi:hypothetical protein